MNHENPQPLVSVIIPVYNVEKYLARCLDSVIKQTYENLEIILVNDGSTDGSEEICRQYAALDGRIRLFTQSNQGLSAARNAGLDHMTGEYIVFVDSDDYISLSLVEILLGLSLEYRVQIAACGRNIICEEALGEGEVYSGRKIGCRLFSRDDIYAMMGKPKGDLFIVVCGKLYTSRLFKTLRFEVGKINEDEFIYHKILNQADKVCYTEAPLYYYVLSSNSITRQDGIGHFHWDAMEAYFSRLEYFRKYGNKKYIKTMGKLIIGLAVRLCEQEKMGTEETKEVLDKIKRKIEQVAGSDFVLPRYYLYCMSPAVYRFVRAARLKMRLVLAKMQGQ